MATAVTMGAPSVSQRKVFVGGLSWETDEQSLRDYFAQYGPVSDCVIMRDRMTGHPRGFGFVTYDDQIVAERVAAEFHELDGRQVEAKIAVPRSECIPAVRTSAWRATKKVFVGGLPATCRENDLHAYFIRFGDIAECQVMYDHQTGNSRGFGFVTFTSETTVDRVVDIEIHEIMAKQVEVKRAEPKQALEARRGREAAAAAAALSNSFAPGHALAPALPSPPPLMSPTKALDLGLSSASSTSTTASAVAAAAAAAAAAVASSASGQPRLSSAPSLPFAPALHQAQAAFALGQTVGGSAAARPFASWTSLFASAPGAAWSVLGEGDAGGADGLRAGGGMAAAAAAAQAAAAAGRPPAVGGATGFFTPGQAYSGELAQCAYNAFYAASTPTDVFSCELPGGLSSARLERRFHPYSSRERVERSFR